MQKMTFLKRDFFSAGPGNHCFSKKMIQTKVPDEDKIRAVLTVKEFLGFVTGKVTKNGFPLEASWVGHPVYIYLTAMNSTIVSSLAEVVR